MEKTILNTANSSSLPRSIPKLKLNLEKLGKSLKLPLGPIISPNPGPTFDIADAEPDIAVTKSNPFIDNNAAKIKKIKKYRENKSYYRVNKRITNFFIIIFYRKYPVWIN